MGNSLSEWTRTYDLRYKSRQAQDAVDKMAMWRSSQLAQATNQQASSSVVRPTSNKRHQSESEGAAPWQPPLQRRRLELESSEDEGPINTQTHKHQVTSSDTESDGDGDDVIVVL